MDLVPLAPASASATLRSLISNARRLDRPCHEREIRELRRIFRALWNSMDGDGRASFHQTDAAIDFAFATEGDPLGRLHLNSADAYFRLVVENRKNWAPASPYPEWVAGDLEEMIAAAWDCLGDLEKEQALASLEAAEPRHLTEPVGSMGTHK